MSVILAVLFVALLCVIFLSASVLAGVFGTAAGVICIIVPIAIFINEAWDDKNNNSQK